MKKALCLLLTSFLVFGCDDDGGSSNDGGTAGQGGAAGAGGAAGSGGQGGSDDPNADVRALCEYLEEQATRCGEVDEEATIEDCIAGVSAQVEDAAAVLSCVQEAFATGYCPESEDENDPIVQCIIAGSPLFQFGNDLVEPFCAKQLDCCPEENAAAYAEVCNFFKGFAVVATLDSVDKGYVEFNPQAARVCTEALAMTAQSLSCEDFLSGVGEDLISVDISECMGVFTPLIGEGGECGETQVEEDGSTSTSASDNACQAGLYCNIDVEGNPTCNALVELGGDCTMDEACGEGGFCGSNGVCAAVLADGAECEWDEQCESEACGGQDEYGMGGICGVFDPSNICEVPDGFGE